MSFRIISITLWMILSFTSSKEIITWFNTMSFFTRYPIPFSCSDFWQMLWAKAFHVKYVTLFFLRLVLSFMYAVLISLNLINTCSRKLVPNTQCIVSVDVWKILVMAVASSHSNILEFNLYSFDFHLRFFLSGLDYIFIKIMTNYVPFIWMKLGHT